MNFIFRFTLRLHALQVDNQLPLSPMPVLLRPPEVEEETDYMFKLTVTMQSNGSLDLCVYPYIGIQVSEACPLHSPNWTIIYFLF